MALNGHHADTPPSVSSGARSAAASSVASGGGGGGGSQPPARERPPRPLRNLFRRRRAHSPDGGDALCARVAVLGAADSGRTAVAAGAARMGPLVRGAGDFASASAGSARTYAFGGSLWKRREAPRVTVVDAGPIPLAGGSSRRALASCDAVILTFALTGIKQRHQRGHSLLSFWGNSGGGGSNPPVVIHSGDRMLLRALFASVAARVKRGSRAPMVSLIGTYKDLLSDSSRAAVEVLLRELRAVCTETVNFLGVPLVVHSLFAINAVDGSCVSENRGGPDTVATMWAFLCDIWVKDVRFKPPTVSFSEESWRQTFPFPRLYQENSTDKAIESTIKSEEDGEECAEVFFGSNDIPSPTSSPVELAINNVYSHLLHFIFHAKEERKTVFLSFESIWRDAYAFGTLGEEHLLAVLGQLAATGEIALFSYQSKGLPGRERCVCLYPYLIERAQATVYLYASYVRDPREKSKKLLTGIDLNTCRRIDAYNDAARGIFSHSILAELMPRLRLLRVPSITVEIFTLLLLLSDTAFVRRSHRILPLFMLPKGSINIDEYNSSFFSGRFDAEGLSSFASSIKTNNPITVASTSFHSLTNDVDYLSIPRWEPPSQLEVVLPALFEAECPRGLISCARRLAGALGRAPRGHCAASRLLTLRPVPSDFFPSLTCRIFPYVDDAATMYTQALWLSSDAHGGHAADNGGEGEKTNVLLRLFLALTPLANGESLLEMHAFCEGGGILPMTLLMNEVTGHVAHLLAQDFPGVAVRVISELPSDVKDALREENGDVSGDFLGISTVRELDSAFRSAS